MNDVVIRAEGISKRYALGQRVDALVSRPRAALGAAAGFLRQFLPQRHTEENSFWALRDVSFEVRRGEVLGIIGRNGAGKSTLLKILSRITEPTEGMAEIRGRVGSLLEVGTGFHPELTGRENIYLNGAILGMQRREIQRNFDAIVAFAEIEKFLDTPVKHYSSGMYTRLAFSVAAHLEPEVLIVDEVLAVGDAAFQRKCLGKMSEVAHHGRTVVFVSHNMGAVKSLCQQGLYMRDGQVVRSGPINECVDAYLHPDEQSNRPFLSFARDERLPVQLLSLAIVSERGEILPQAPHDAAFAVEIKVLVRQRTPGVYLALHIHDQDLATLIFSRDFESDPQLLEGREPGVYTLLVRPPRQLLIPGDYSISVHVAHAKYRQIIHRADHVCNFEVVDSGSARAKAGMGWFGKVGLPMSWEEAPADARVDGAVLR